MDTQIVVTVGTMNLGSSTVYGVGPLSVSVNP